MKAEVTYSDGELTVSALESATSLLQASLRSGGSTQSYLDLQGDGSPFWGRQPPEEAGRTWAPSRGLK